MLTLPPAPRAASPLIATPGSFPYKTAPMTHQRHDLRTMARRAFWAWFWEQGTGKSKVELDNAGYLYLAGHIDALLHVAPIGAHRGFLEEQVPVHMTDAVPTVPLLWNTGAMQRMAKGQIRWKPEVEAVLATARGAAMPIISIGIDALRTDVAKSFLSAFFAERRVMMTVDESADIANVKSARWQAADQWGQRAVVRRIQNGTPAPEGSPFHYFGQMRFLDRFIFREQKFFGFQQRYASMIRVPQPGGVVRTEDGAVDPVRTRFMWMVETDRDGNKVWRHTDELRARVYAHASRYLKDDVLDLPPKVYEPLRYFTLTREQRRVYDAVVEEYVYANPTGTTTYAELAIVRARRLYQITRGYVGVEQGEPRYIIPGKNPALDLLAHMIEEGRGQPTLLWVWEKMSQTLVSDLLTHMGIRFGRYDGSISEAERARNKQRYLDGSDEILLAQPQAFGRSHTVVNTRRVIFYENDFKYYWRVQAEDRPHRSGLTHSVLYSDLVAEATVDETKVMRALRSKHDVAAVFTGDPTTDWRT